MHWAACLRSMCSAVSLRSRHSALETSSFVFDARRRDCTHHSRRLSACRVLARAGAPGDVGPSRGTIPTICCCCPPRTGSHAKDHYLRPGMLQVLRLLFCACDRRHQISSGLTPVP
jgi:hypothetical protein